MTSPCRSTSISNVAGASLTRRSSERELADSGAKKRASSSTDRQDGESRCPRRHLSHPRNRYTHTLEHSTLAETPDTHNEIKFYFAVIVIVTLDTRKSCN